MSMQPLMLMPGLMRCSTQMEYIGRGMDNMSSIRLLRGDCNLKLENIPNHSIDLVIMDPPYLQTGSAGSGAFGGEHRNYYNELSCMSHGISNETLDLILSKLKRINIYIYCNKKQIQQYLNYFIPKGVNFDLLCWHKLNPIPATNNIYLRDSEYILFFREKGVKLYGSYQTKKTYFLSGINLKDKNRFDHPTVKPLDQIKTFIENSSLPGDTVLDPFMGTGTTGVGCKQMGRSFVGIEIENRYFNTARERIRSAARE